MAQYHSTMDYQDKNAIHIWQYSSKGKVVGITGAVDKNICLVPLRKLLQIQRAGWIEQDGKQWYRHMDGSYTQNDWEQIEEKWYHFDRDGWMQTGWIKLDGKWYYLKESGDMASNEILMLYSNIYGNETYAFAADGHMMKQINDRGVLV